MKKLSTIIIAAALLLGMAQCKKQETPASEGNVVRITLNVGGNDNGSRVIVTPPDVNFENGDTIVVASNGAVVGTMTTEDGSIFDGEIVNPTEGQPLYFYFLGNKQGTVANGTDGLTVNISDQTTDAGLPVISMGASTVDYSSDVNSYNADLRNMASLQKFNVTTTSTEAICITGMNNTVTVDFSKATNDNENYGFTYGKDGDGLIKMPAKGVDNVTWAIVLPQDALQAGAAGSAYTADSACTGSRPAIHEIERNKFYDDAIELVLNAAPTIPEGAINGKFTINANGDQVYFSKGNLQYIGSAGNGDNNNTGGYWKLADNQWEYFGDNGQDGNSQTINRDLFGWGTSGYNYGPTCYQPWSTSGNRADYCNYNALTGQADWGYNAISNGGNQENIGWRTLTVSEWDHVFNNRTMQNGRPRYTLGKKVADKFGTIIYPDDYSGDVVSTNLTAEEWAPYEEAGCIFLPAAGNCIHASSSHLYYYYNGNNADGKYWTATGFDAGSSNFLYFTNNELNTTNKTQAHSYSFSVRLVIPVE